MTNSAGTTIKCSLCLIKDKNEADVYSLIIYVPALTPHLHFVQFFL